MPELPEVELFRRYLDDHLLGRSIIHVRAGDAFMRRGGVSERRIRESLRGRQFSEARRHGKWVFLSVHGVDAKRNLAWLVLHFGMTGSPVVVEAGRPVPRFPRFVVDFDDGTQFVLDDARRLGGVGLTQSPEAWVREHRLGPDALNASASEVAEALGRRRGRLKPLFLDQTVVAGVGNVYADEILFQSRLHPLKRVDELAVATIGELAENTHRVLAAAVDLGALFHLMPDEWLVHRRRAGAPCPACGGAVERITLAGRSTYFCPECQRL